MPQITRDSLMTLEVYARSRDEFRTKVIAHKKNRTMQLGPRITLLFEDELTIRYQVQEMLRIERIFEAAGIDDELATYNSLVPDGSNWKATMLIEYPDVEERKRMLAVLKGVEQRVWVQIAGCERVYAIADEDLERTTEEKTSAVHFLRFELTAVMKGALAAGAILAAGMDHPQYNVAVDNVGLAVRTSLLQDLRM